MLRMGEPYDGTAPGAETHAMGPGNPPAVVECEKPGCGTPAGTREIITPFGTPAVCSEHAAELEAAYRPGGDTDTARWLLTVMRHGPAFGRHAWLAGGGRA